MGPTNRPVEMERYPAPTMHSPLTSTFATGPTNRPVEMERYPVPTTHSPFARSLPMSATNQPTEWEANPTLSGLREPCWETPVAADAV